MKSLLNQIEKKKAGDFILHFNCGHKLTVDLEYMLDRNILPNRYYNLIFNGQTLWDVYEI